MCAMCIPGAMDSWDFVTDSCRLPCGCWELYLGCLEKYSVFLPVRYFPPDFRYICSIFLCDRCASMYVCVPCACLTPAEVRRGHRLPPNLELKMVVNHHMGAETEQVLALSFCAFSPACAVWGWGFSLGSGFARAAGCPATSQHLPVSSPMLIR